MLIFSKPVGRRIVYFFPPKNTFKLEYVEGLAFSEALKFITVATTDTSVTPMSEVRAATALLLIAGN
jgi:hypothetical protein